jgi:hypothetical protein
LGFERALGPGLAWSGDWFDIEISNLLRDKVYWRHYTPVLTSLRLKNLTVPYWAIFRSNLR